MAKSHQLPFPSSYSQYFAPLELVYSDVWGLAVKTVNGYHYYVSFVDAYSWYTWIYLLKQQSDVPSTFL